MSAYSKFFGAIIGGILGVLVSKFGLPAELSSPEVVGGLTTLASAVVTWLAPANAA